MMLRRALLLIPLLLLLSAAPQPWQPVAPGVAYQRITRGSIDVHVTKIDLRNRAIRVIASTAAERGLTVSEYAKATNAIAAINADYFDTEQRPIGLAMGACGVWTKGEKVGRKQGLVAVGRRRAEIQARTMNTKRWMTGAVSGWPMLISGCTPMAELPGSDHFTRAPHPRTAVGLSKSGRTMYFVAADGRKEGVPGMTLPELAAFMHEELKVCSAMNLDGGGSTAMWVDDAIVNRPSDGPERKVGNHLAVIAARDYRGCDTRRKKD